MSDTEHAAPAEGGPQRQPRPAARWWPVMAITAWALFLALAVAFWSERPRTAEQMPIGGWTPGAADEAPAADSSAADAGLVGGGSTASGGEGEADGSQTRLSARLSASAAAALLARAEERQAQGDFHTALKGYEHLRRQAAGPLADKLDFRISYCAEALGDVDRAIAGYQKLADSSSSPRLRDVCRIGQARLHLSEGSHEIAVELLSRVRAAPASHRTEADVSAVAAHLLADGHSRQATRDVARRPLMDDGVFTPDAAPDVDLLAMADKDPAHPGDADATAAGPVVVREAAHPEHVQVSGSIEDAGVHQLVDQLLGEAGFAAAWSAPAERSLLRRGRASFTGSMALSTVLDLLLPSELVWSFAEGAVRIRAASELPADERRALFIDRARRALSVAAFQFPEAELSPVTLLWLGSLAFLEGQSDTARGFFEQVRQAFPRSPAARDASFNLAKTHLAQGDSEEALVRFFDVVDAGAGGAGEPYAYLYAGRLLIESGQPDRAVAELLRARAVAKTAETRIQAALLLSTAYLMSSNPHGANLVLMQHRDELSTGRPQRLAAALSSIARHQAAVRGRRKVTEAQAVLEALSHVQPDEFFGRYGWWLMGDAYARLGFSGRAMALFEDGLARGPAVPFRREMQFRLAELRLQHGDRLGALELWGELANSDDPQAAGAALMRLAELGLEEGDLPGALSFVRSALHQDLDAPARVRALQVMGRIYRRAGDHGSAAICFAGAVPTADLSGGVE